MKQILAFLCGAVVAVAVVSSRSASAQTPCPPAIATASVVVMGAATEAPIASGDAGTHDNPVPLGESAAVTLDLDKTVFNLSVTEVDTGAVAASMLAKANEGNAQPPSGMIDLLVLIQGTMVSSPSGGTGQLTDIDFAAVSDGQFSQYVYFMTPSPAIQFTGFPGARIKGYVAFQIFADDPHPLLVAGSNVISHSGGTYFALTK